MAETYKNKVLSLLIPASDGIKACQLAAWFMILFIGASIMTEKAMPLTTSVETSVGYDDNASLSSSGQGSAFIAFSARLDQMVTSEDLPIDFDIFVDTFYNSYFRLSDHYHLKTGSSLTWRIAQGRILPGIFAGLSMYYDDLNEDDENNEIMAGAKIDWNASGRLKIGVRYNWYYIDYRNPLITFKPPKDIFEQQTQGLPPDPLKEKIYQQDNIHLASIEGTIYLNSNLQTDLSLEYSSCDSSIDLESYNETGIAFSVWWTPIEQCETEAFISLRQLEYENIPEIDRKDIFWSMGLSISRFIDKYELFLRLDRSENHSDLENESYKKTVIQCGIGRLF